MTHFDSWNVFLDVGHLSTRSRDYNKEKDKSFRYKKGDIRRWVIFVVELSPRLSTTMDRIELLDFKDSLTRTLRQGYKDYLDEVVGLGPIRIVG